MRPAKWLEMQPGLQAVELLKKAAINPPLGALYEVGISPSRFGQAG